jgi:hypothetical protein
MSTDHVAAALALVTQLKELMGANQFAKAQELLAPIKVRVRIGPFSPFGIGCPNSRLPIVLFFRTTARSVLDRMRSLLFPRTVSNQTRFGRSLSFNSPPRKTTRQNCGKVCSLVRQCLDQRLFASFPFLNFASKQCLYPDFCKSDYILKFSYRMHSRGLFVCAAGFSMRGGGRRGARAVRAAVGRAQANRRV